MKQSIYTVYVTEAKNSILQFLTQAIENYIFFQFKFQGYLPPASVDI